MKIEQKFRDLSSLQDILSTIEMIEVILQSAPENLVTQKALERCFEILGEACRRISEETKNQYPEIPWANIIALRNVISHEYDKVDIETLWDIAEHKIPALKDWIIGIVHAIEKPE